MPAPRGERAEDLARLPVGRLLSEVVDVGLCAGCGTCVGLCPEDCLRFAGDTPEYSGGCSNCMACVDGCPGRELPMPELERLTLGRESAEGERLGVYRTACAGYALDPSVRAAGTSGGMVTAILCSLLSEGHITGAVCTVFDETLPFRPTATVLRDPSAILSAAQSKYSLVPQMAALREARPDDRLAVVGLPCQIAGLRKASLAGHMSTEVVVSIGLFCLSTFRHEATVFIIEEIMGLSLADVTALEYRHGPFPGSFHVTTADGGSVSLPYGEAKQYLRMFRPYRCMVCLDWSSELADLSAGDLWSDPSRRAYTSLLVRTGSGAEALKVAEGIGAVRVEHATPAAIGRNPGLYYKKHGNAAFLREARTRGLPCPTHP